MSVKIETKCIHLEEKIEQAEKEDACKTLHYGSVSFPIYQSATYAHPAVGESTGYDYSRLQNPTRAQVEKVVAQLEDGIDAFRKDLKKVARKRLESGADVKAELLYIDVIRRIENIGDNCFNISESLTNW